MAFPIVKLIEIEAAFKNLKDDFGAAFPFFTNSSTGSRRTFLWPSSPTACT